MKYNNGEIIRVNDVIRVHLKDNINDNRLAIINRIKDNFLYCESIANGLPVIINYTECELCYRNDKDTIFYWRRIIDTNVSNFIAKYKDIKYIRNNWFSDPFVNNNITAKTLLNKAKIKTLNDVQAQNILLEVQPIIDIIIAYSDYEFCKKYYKAFIDVKVTDEEFNNLFAAIWNC